MLSSLGSFSLQDSFLGQVSIALGLIWWEQIINPFNQHALQKVQSHWQRRSGGCKPSTLKPCSILRLVHGTWPLARGLGQSDQQRNGRPVSTYTEILLECNVFPTVWSHRSSTIFSPHLRDLSFIGPGACKPLFGDHRLQGKTILSQALADETKWKGVWGRGHLGVDKGEGRQKLKG